MADEDVFPVKNGGFSIAMLVYRRVTKCPLGAIFFSGHVSFSGEYIVYGKEMARNVFYWRASLALFGNIDCCSQTN